MNFYRIIAFVFLISIISINGVAQTNKAIASELRGHLNRLSKNVGNEKALDRENKLIKQKLIKYGKRASTLKYSFSELDGQMYIATSKDGKLRIYSWDTKTGGTMKFFDGIYQYQNSRGKVYSKPYPASRDFAARGFYSQIFEVDTGTGKAYLANSNLILSNAMMHQDLEAFAIEGAKLNTDLRLIRTTTAMRNSVGFDYDFFSVVDRPERPVKLFSYDETKKQFSFPIVLKDKKFPNGGRVTNKFITYRFNGKYFVKI